MRTARKIHREAIDAADTLLVEAGKSKAEGFSQTRYDAAVAKTKALQRELNVAKASEIAAAIDARPIGGQDRSAPRVAASPRVQYGKIKHFKDYTVDGQTVRAADQAFESGMFLLAAVWEKDFALEYCRDHGIAITKAPTEGITTLKAQGEGIDSAGGFLAPDDLAHTIITLRETFGVFRRESRVIPMGSDTLNWPRRTGGLTAYFTGENQAIPESQAAFDNVNFTAKKLATLTRISNEIAEDAVIAIADLVVGEIAYAMASKEDDCGFNGDGTSAYGGIRGLTQLAIDGNHNYGKLTASHNTFSTLTMTDMTSLMGLLPQFALPGAKWYISHSGFYQTVAGLKAGAGGNTTETLPESPDDDFLGFPTVISQKLPSIATSLTGKAMLFFGDLMKASTLAERRGVEIYRSVHRYFEFDQVGVLGRERFDINNHDLGDNSTAGPLVALVAP